MSATCELDTLFIVPGFPDFYPVMPGGVISMAQALDSKGYQVGVWDMHCDPSLSLALLEKALQRVKVRFAGVSLLSAQVRAAQEIALLVKNCSPNTIVVAGGLHLSATNQPLKNADCSVVGDGEEIMLDLVSGRRPPERLVRVQEPVELSSLGLPGSQVLETYADFGPWPKVVVNVSRGCPYKCAFCLGRDQRNATVRRLNPAVVGTFVQDVVRAFRATPIFFTDDIFTIHKPWMMAVCDQLEILGLASHEFHCFTHVKVQDPAIFKRLAETGFREVQIGIESGDARVLNDMGKDFTPEDARQTVELIRSGGLLPSCLFILGYATDTIESMERTLEFAASLKAPVWFSMAQPIPGTEFYGLAQKQGTLVGTGDYSVRSISYLPPGVTLQQMQDLQVRAEEIRERSTAYVW